MRPALLVAVALLATGLSPAAAAADSVAARDTTAASDQVAARFDLTRAQRRALDIATVRVSGLEGLGVTVSVGFRGDVAPLLGAGRLGRAGIALLVHPVAGGEPRVVVTEGGGDHERLRASWRARSVAAGRIDHRVKFLLWGWSLAGIGRVEVATLPRVSAADPGLGPRFDDLELALDPSVTTPDQPECGEQARLYRDITIGITALDRSWRRFELSPATATARLIKRMRGVALAFGGEAEVSYNEDCP